MSSKPFPQSDTTQHGAISADVEAEAGKSKENLAPERPNLVTWVPNDSEYPRNWSTRYRVFVISIWIVGSLVTCIASSIFSSGSPYMQKEFRIGPIVTTLGVSVFLMGYTVGAPIWAPLSEKLGRKIPMLVGMASFTIFCIPVAMGTNIQTVFVGRFFCGVFSVSPLTIIGGVLVDLWDPVDRGVATAASAGAIFGGPILGPIIGNFIAASYLGWRWDNWLSGIMGIFCVVLIIFGLPETYGPTILRKRAAKIRNETGNKDAKCIYDGEANDIRAIFRVYLVRPFALLATEPILTFITIYQAFVYGILYLVLISYPIAFREVRGWPVGLSGLPYLGMIVGISIGCGIVIYCMKTIFAKRIHKNKGNVIPEDCLPLMIAGGCFIPIGLLIFAWTSKPSIPWAGMVMGSIPVGVGMYMVFVQCLNYLVDVYPQVAGSAFSANSFVRSFFGAGFPLFGPAMYHNLGAAWATTVLAIISIFMIPIPILFYKYGHKIRSWSKNVVNNN